MQKLTVFLFALLLGMPGVSRAEELVLYSGRGEALVAPLLEIFEAETGIQLDVRYNKTPALATQLMLEGTASPADVIFFQDSGYLGALSENGFLEKLPSSLLAQVSDRFQDENGYWIGTSGRARVLVYNPTLVSEEEMPKSLEELADPRWKGRLGWAPGNSSLQAHVSALRHLWGEEKTRAWLEKMAKNEAVVYPKNSPQVRAVANEEIAIGWVNHYYVHRMVKPGMNAKAFSFPAEHDAGNLLMVSGVAIRKGTSRQAQAEKLVEFLASETAQHHFAAENFEYPTRPGVEAHADVAPLASLNLVDVDQSSLADVGPTLELLQDLKLQ